MVIFIVIFGQNTWQNEGGVQSKKNCIYFFFQIWDVEKDLQYNFQNSGVGAWGVDWIT